MTVSRTDVTVGVLGEVRAMASDITLYGHATVDPPDPDPVVDQALSVFTSVHEACTRFDPDSPLMRANARPDEWHTVPLVLLAAVREAHRAYQRTDGRFDPRSSGTWCASATTAASPSPTVASPPTGSTPPGRPLPRWTPRLRYGRRPELHLGGIPIDLGGIGKSLAVRWASEELQEHFEDFLLDAGGDCYCEGTGPEEDGWRVGVEDPFGGALPVAVLALSDKACATSSTKVRQWRAGGRAAHHLIDPTTGRPGGDGLVAVTVVDADPTRAEVATKYLFLGGADGDRRGGPHPPHRRTVGHHRRDHRHQPDDGLLRHLAGRMTAPTPTSMAPTGLPPRRVPELDATHVGPVGASGTVAVPDADWTTAPFEPGIDRTGTRSPQPVLAPPRRTAAELGRLVVVLAGVLLVSWAIGRLTGTQGRTLVHNKMLPWILGRGLGVAAYVSLTAMVVLGLWLRHPWRARFRRPSPADHPVGPRRPGRLPPSPWWRDT